MMMKTRWPKQAGVLLPGILSAILIWYAGAGVAKAACNAGNILYNDLEIVLSKDVVCVGGTVTATVTTDPPGANVTLTSIPSIPPKISISPTVGLPGVFTITGVTESDLPGDVPLLATIVSGEETDPEVVSCIKSIPNALTVIKVEIAGIDRKAPKTHFQVYVTTTPNPAGTTLALECVADPGTGGPITFESPPVISGSDVVLMYAGVNQSWGSTGPAPDNMKLRVILNGVVCAEEAFTICAHPRDLSNEMDLPNIKYGFKVKVLWNSDEAGGTSDRSGLAKVILHEFVDVPAYPNPPFTPHPDSPTPRTYYQPPLGGIAGTGTGTDLHLYSRLLVESPPIAASVTDTQLMEYKCERCDNQWHTLASGITIERSIHDNNSGVPVDYWFKTVKSGVLNTGTIPLETDEDIPGN